MKNLEQEIEFTENTIRDIEEQLTQPAEDYRETMRLCEQLDGLRRELGGLYDRWLELNGDE